MKRYDWSRIILWAVYLALLAVLLPHTAWAFGQFEPPGWRWLGWVAAIAFEGAIAAFTWRLKGHIEQPPHPRKPWRQFCKRYLNIYAVGLFMAIGVSAFANWAHAVQFAQPFAVYGGYSVPPLLYSLAFGAILPFCSLLFARILANVENVETDDEVRDLRRRLNAAERQASQAEDAARFLLQLTAEDKAQRILAAAQHWPELHQAGIAVVTGTSPSYVSQVLTRKEID
jgi:hypothetical protein